MHYSVLLQESIDNLNINPNGTYIDATFGRGGHSLAILERLTNGRLIAFDKDMDAVAYAKGNFSKFDNFQIVHSSFTQIYNYCCVNGLIGKIDGIVMDLGVSSPQLDEANRGFSFMQDGPLDMRMDTTNGYTAKEVLENLTVDELAYIFKVYGEERFAKKIAFRIKRHLEANPIETTKQLADIIRATIGNRERKNPATRCFQAIRIYVNNELEDLEILLNNVLDIVAVGGRIAGISFHSLEDRILKNYFTSLVNPSQPNDRISRMLPQSSLPIKAKWIAKKIKANASELDENVRSRSAILRVVEKL